MDIHVSDMDNYIALKKQLEKNNKNLEKANKKSLELKQNSKDIKDKIDNTNKEYDKIQNLSNTFLLLENDKEVNNKNENKE